MSEFLTYPESADPALRGRFTFEGVRTTGGHDALRKPQGMRRPDMDGYDTRVVYVGKGVEVFGPCPVPDLWPEFNLPANLKTPTYYACSRAGCRYVGTSCVCRVCGLTCGLANSYQVWRRDATAVRDE